MPELIRWALRPVLVVIAAFLAAATAPFWALIAALSAILGLIWLIVDIIYTLTHWA